MEPSAPHSFSNLSGIYARQIRASGQPVRSIEKILPPHDTGGRVEVLFLTPTGEPLTAYFDDADHEAEPLICSGW